MATSPPVAKYIISRYADPVFALLIGLSAAVLRIRKEETEKRSGMPSTSMVISATQQNRMDKESEHRRKNSPEPSTMYGPTDYGTSETFGGYYSSQMGESEEKPEVGYVEILQLGWERMKWKADHEWYGRGKEYERKDGRLV